MSVKMESCLQDASKHFLYLLFIFLFVHLTIILPFKHSIKNYEIREADKSINDQLSLINKKVLLLKTKIDTISKMQVNLTKELKAYNDSIKERVFLEYASQPSQTVTNAPIPDSTVEKRISAQLATISDSVAIMEDALFAQQAKKFDYQSAKVDLLKQKGERSFTIPILGISINESIILFTYPAFILFGLSSLLYYRKRSFDCYAKLRLTEKSDVDFPFWAAPIPYCYRNKGRQHWFMRNTLGLSLHFIMLFVLFDFMLFFQKVYTEKKVDNEVIAINTVIAISALFIYTYTIIHTYKLECNPTNP